jgi:4-amino-4-deoxychorismate lyase
MLEQLPKFELLESLLWSPNQGYFLLDRHLERLERAADYFNFSLSLTEVCEALEALSMTFGADAQKVRLTLSGDGRLTLQAQRLDNGILKIGASHFFTIRQLTDYLIQWLWSHNPNVRMSCYGMKKER